MQGTSANGRAWNAQSVPDYYTTVSPISQPAIRP